MTTTTLRFAQNNFMRKYQITKDYKTDLKPQAEQVRQAARIWFNQRKLRQQARYALSFVSLPRYVTLKYKLR